MSESGALHGRESTDGGDHASFGHDLFDVVRVDSDVLIGVDVEVPGQDSGFLHTHKTHEELYFILKGEGEYQVDGEVFPVTEGSIIRVAPEGKRALKNTGKDEMLMLCIQYKANSFAENDAPAGDGVILNEELKW